jgi:hypothetical protein
MDTPTIRAGHHSRAGTIIVAVALTIAASALAIQARSIWSTHVETTHVVSVEDTGAVVGPASPLETRTHAAMSYWSAEAKDLSAGRSSRIVRPVHRPSWSQIRKLK